MNLPEIKQRSDLINNYISYTSNESDIFIISVTAKEEIGS